MYDLAILGAGPAGLTAAVYAARKKLNTVLIAKDIGGQVLTTLGVENYMGYQYVEGPELIEKFEKQMSLFPIEQKIGEKVAGLSKQDKHFEIKVESGQTFTAKAVIIATGKRPRPLNVPGEDKLRGKGVTYCAICDGPVFTGQKVVVVGGGNSALEAVYDLLKYCPEVNLVSLKPLTCDKIMIDRVKDNPNLRIFLEYQTLEILGNEIVEGLRIKSLKTGEITVLTVGGVFVEIGLIPNSDFVKGLLKLNSFGEIEVNKACETGIPGLYAAGDVTDVTEKQIIVAAGEGSKATLQADRYLQRLS